jgi:hypothetical protein
MRCVIPTKKEENLMRPSVWTYGLLGVGLGIYIAGFILGRPNAELTHRSPTGARMINSATLVVAALVWWRGVAMGTPFVGYAVFVFLGMACSFVGDLLMARVIPLPVHPIPGIVAFGVAHVFYILGCVQIAQVLGAADGRIWAVAVLALELLGVVLWRTLIYSPEASPVLAYGALGYALLLAGTTGAAIALAIQEPRLTVLAVGAVLFLISDAILGNRLLRDNDWFMVGDVVWAIYIAGQSFIVFTLPAVL